MDENLRQIANDLVSSLQDDIDWLDEAIEQIKLMQIEIIPKEERSKWPLQQLIEAIQQLIEANKQLLVATHLLEILGSHEPNNEVEAD